MCFLDHLRVSKIPLLWAAAGELNPEVCRTFQKIRLADRLFCLHEDRQIPDCVTEHRFLSHEKNWDLGLSDRKMLLEFIEFNED